MFYLQGVTVKGNKMKNVTSVSLDKLSIVRLYKKLTKLQGLLDINELTLNQSSQQIYLKQGHMYIKLCHSILKGKTVFNQTYITRLKRKINIQCCFFKLNLCEN